MKYGQCEASGKFGRCNRARVATGHPYCDTHAVAHGVRQTRVPTDGVKVVVSELLRGGWSLQLIADASGVNFSTLRRALAGEHMLSGTAQKIASLHGTTHDLCRVPAWPSARRLRSLQAAGHTGVQLEAGTGVPDSTISKITKVEGCTVAAYQAGAIDKYWREHCTDPVGAPTATAKREQWPVPMWWEDIDDPREKPGVTHCVNCHAPEVGDISPLCKRCRNSRNGHAYRQRQKRKAKAA